MSTATAATENQGRITSAGREGGGGVGSHTPHTQLRYHEFCEQQGNDFQHSQFDHEQKTIKKTMANHEFKKIAQLPLQRKATADAKKKRSIEVQDASSDNPTTTTSSTRCDVVAPITKKPPGMKKDKSQPPTGTSNHHLQQPQEQKQEQRQEQAQQDQEQQEQEQGQEQGQEQQEQEQELPIPSK